LREEEREKGATRDRARHIEGGKTREEQKKTDNSQYQKKRQNGLYTNQRDLNRSTIEKGRQRPKETLGKNKRDLDRKRKRYRDSTGREGQRYCGNG